MGKQYEKYGHTNIKLFTNDIKVAIISAPLSLIIASSLPQPNLTSTLLYIAGGSAAFYSAISLYSHKKEKTQNEKKKKFTLL